VARNPGVHLVGIPLVFILISTFEWPGMWNYTYGLAVKKDAIPKRSGKLRRANACTVTIAQITATNSRFGPGLFTISSL